jgi:threonine dehydrogenase-like Zn-dependent dehydrogenase
MGASSRTAINPNLSQSRLQHEQHLRNSIIPGRSFFGKVLEIGKAVKKLRRGELVYGLQELSKVIFFFFSLRL